ncbi:hypothetical protein C7S15_7076 [Burkholderia cepacia]|nr:hypothetical protein [Burkholderia cepacia]
MTRVRSLKLRDAAVAARSPVGAQDARCIDRPTGKRGRIYLKIRSQLSGGRM